MADVTIEYCGPAAEVLLPAMDRSVKRGEAFAVPADLAGSAPSPWRAATPEECAAGGGFTPDGWPLRPTGDGWETHDPGHGLLAQVENWRPAKPAPAAADSTPKGA